MVLFQRNVGNTEELLDLTQKLQQTAKDAGHEHPLFIGIDQENGLVTRIKAPYAAQLPGGMTLGATGSVDSAVAVGQATGETLKFYGINFNYAPICDVNSEPKNPVIGVRSPSDDPVAVGRFASATAKGLRSQGVIPCAKHFPGHGDTAVDSHYGLPVIEKSKAAFEACELVPFRQAISEDIESIMTAHISLQGLANDTLPASLSPAAMNLLRAEMGYDGLVVTDCLEMDGVRATYGTEKSAVMALQAGNDCVMICHTYDVQVRACDLVCQAVRAGELTQSQIEQATARVRKLKTQYLGWESALASSSSSSRAKQLEDFKALTAVQEKLARRVYESSTTIVRSEPGFLPLKPRSPGSILYLSPGGDPSERQGGAVASGEVKTRVPYTDPAFVGALREYHPDVVNVRFHPGQDLPESVQKAVDEADVVILATRNALLHPYQKEMGLKLAREAKRLIVVATCDPYDFLDDAELVRNYIVVYEPTVPAFAAAVRAIFGESAALGRLPVRS